MYNILVEDMGGVVLTNQLGPVVRGRDCYGRDHEVDLLWERLSRGHVLLAAPRRFGKTSLMYRLLDAPRWSYKVILADLEHLNEPAEFVTWLLDALARNPALAKLTGSLSFVPKRLWHGLLNTVEEVELFKLRVKLRAELRDRWQESGEELFRKLAASSEPVVIMLDEFPVMIDRVRRSSGSENARILLHWLRQIRQSPGNENLRFVLAGSIGIDSILNELGEISTINDFERIRLDPFSPRLASKFLDELAQGARVPLSPSVKKRMMKLIGVLVPYFLRVLFAEVEKAHRRDGDDLTPKTVDRIYHERVLGVACKGYFDHYYSRLSAHYSPAEERAVKSLLREMASTETLTRDVCRQHYRREVGETASTERFLALMVELENDFYIDYLPQKTAYQFTCKLLRDWWLRHYGMSTND
jgi:hypothetical protein